MTNFETRFKIAYLAYVGLVNMIGQEIPELDNSFLQLSLALDDGILVDEMHMYDEWLSGLEEALIKLNDEMITEM